MKKDKFLTSFNQRAAISKWAILFLLFVIISFPVFSQIDTARIKREQQQSIQKMQEAQKQAMQQLKQLGIDIDPNKKMTKEQAEEIKKKLIGKGKEMQKQLGTQIPGKIAYQRKNVELGKAPTEMQVVQIADRFFKRSYKTLTAIEKSQFDVEYKLAEKNKFTLTSVRTLTNRGAELITFGDDHNIACVYLAAAVKNLPGDTLSVNNFGGYLRIIDSLQASLPVLLYANQLFSESPVILTQIGCSLLELNDETKAEKYLLQALKFNPAFGQAHSALCEVYIRQHRLKDAILELFAGVKNIGASYMQASNTNYQIQQQYDAAGKDDFESKEEFWNETKKQLQPPGGGTVSENLKIKMPVFPDCVNVEDWTVGGGYMKAFQSYQAFHEFNMESAKKFVEVHQQRPNIPENATLRDYPNERLALDCITEMFAAYSNQEAKKYHKIIDQIVQRMLDARERYLKNFAKYMQEYSECLQACPAGDEICPKECFRKYCMQQCPNANAYNNELRIIYGNYRMAFSGMLHEQIKLLDDLQAFSEPWFSKIESPYWSRIYAYEIRRVALLVIGNTYMYYPQFIDSPVMSECGQDCSVFAKPFTREADEVDKNDPEGNNCPPNSKFKIPLAICELGLDCESIEFGCTAGVSASVKKNFKKNNTTLFVGVGIKGELGVVSAGAKAGVVVTVGSNGEVQDVGGKVDLSVSAGVGAARMGVSSSGSLTVMKGVTSNVGFSGGLGKPK